MVRKLCWFSENECYAKISREVELNKQYEVVFYGEEVRLVRHCSQYDVIYFIKEM